MECCTDASQVIAQTRASPLPANKVTLGLPFYGRRVGSGQWETYEDIHQRMRGQQKTGDQAMTADGKGKLYYNPPDTIETKVKLALQAGLGGVMIWEAGQDCRLVPVHRNGRTHARTCASEDASLLVAIKRALESQHDVPPPHREL